MKFLSNIIILFAFLSLFCCQPEPEKPEEKLPELSTTEISSITSGSAVSGGTITDEGSSSVTDRGVVWNTSSSPTIALTTKTSDGTGSGNFTSNIASLQPGKTYFVRAYATNSAGTAYGNELSFSSSATTPSVTTGNSTDVGAFSFAISGNISSDGGSAVTAKGLVWNTSAEPTIALATKTSETGTGSSFSTTILELQPQTIYYIRAYSTNSVGTSYGNQVTVQTIANQITAPPASLQLNSFYKKYLDAYGIPVISSNAVPDEALFVVQRTIMKMVRNRKDVLAAMIQKKHRVGIMGKSEKTTNMPEHSDLNTAFPGTNWDQYRGLGATVQRPLTSCAEENVLCYGQGQDIYWNEDILIHEFMHGYHLLGIKFVDVNIDTELESAFNAAKANGLWANTYAGSHVHEYFAEGVQSWFNINAQAVPTNGIHNHVNTREELKAYDLTLYNIIKRYFPEDSEKLGCH
jgi:hypothetical protein